MSDLIKGIYVEGEEWMFDLQEKIKEQNILEYQQYQYQSFQNNIPIQNSIQNNNYENYLEKLKGEEDLINSIESRARYMNRVDIIDKVKQLTTLPDGKTTSKIIADYFEVNESTLRKLIERNFDELSYNGMIILRGEELNRYRENFESDIMSLTNSDINKIRNLTLFTKRTVLNIAMLLRDSLVARAIREILLNMADIETQQGQERFNQYADELQIIRNDQKYIKENINKLVYNLIDEDEPEIIDGKVYIKRCNTIINKDKKN